MKKIPLVIALSFLGFMLTAQNQKVQFNGVARGNIESNSLGENDTTNIDQSIKGNALVDLRFDIRPSDNIRINTDFRFNSPMGGFWGNGSIFQVRHVSMKGVANKYFKYRFGDIDLKMTPKNTGMSGRPMPKTPRAAPSTVEILLLPIDLFPAATSKFLRVSLFMPI